MDPCCMRVVVLRKAQTPTHPWREIFIVVEPQSETGLTYSSSAILLHLFERSIAGRVVGMSIKIDDLEARESNTTSLTLPMGEGMKARYRRIQSELEKRKKRPLHSITREQIDRILSDLEKALGLAG